jgi:hypothetical protein
MTIDWHKIIYNSGDVFLPEPIKNLLAIFIYKYPNTTKESDYIFYLQGWSIIHFLSGIITGYLYLYFGYNKQRYFLTMFMINTTWETWQVIIGMSKPYNIIGRNGMIDTLVDTTLFMLGSYLFFYYNKKMLVINKKILVNK